MKRIETLAGVAGAFAAAAVRPVVARFIAIVAIAALAGAVTATPAGAALIPSADGQTIHDTTLHVTWLANADLPATQKFGVTGINPKGSMTYRTAQQWVQALNAAGYLGHRNWQLPTAPQHDASCAKTGRHGESFGFGCSGSALGSLYSTALGLREPNSAVAVPANRVGSFHDVQPYLYWSASAATDPKQGFVSFSFDNGFQGANVPLNYLYVLPMIKGQVRGSGTVYDPVADVSWLADANLAAKNTFGVAGINAGGSMDHRTAVRWINALDRAGYLGHTHWKLPETVAADQTCSIGTRSGFGCKNSPLGALFYGVWELHAGDSAVPVLDVKTGPFHAIQPYLYWACAAGSARAPCERNGPAPNFEWNFSFGSGFQGTNLDGNELYVMVYYPDAPG